MMRSFVLSIACLSASWAPPLASQAPTVRSATLLWQVDGSESGEPFGALRDLLLHRDGSVWAFDFKDQVIRRYDAGGKPRPAVGRKGSGPGEMRNANGMAMAPDGNVWVNDPANGRLSVFSEDGKVARSVSHSLGGYRFHWGGWFDTSGKLVEPAIGASERLLLVDESGRTTGTLPAPTCGERDRDKAIIHARNSDKSYMNLGYPFGEGGGFRDDRQGHVWCATRSSTRLVKLALGRNDTLARTSVEIPMIAVEAREREVVLRSVLKEIAKYQTNDYDPHKVPTHKAGIRNFSVDSDGRLWVAHTPPWLKATTTLDVFDGSGRSQFRVSIPLRHHPSMPILARGNEFTLVTIDDDEIVHIARFRLR